MNSNSFTQMEVKTNAKKILVQEVQMYESDLIYSFGKFLYVYLYV